MDSILTDILRLVHHGGHFKNLDNSEIGVEKLAVSETAE